MTLHLHLDHDRRVYLTLSCDHCGAPFTCYDDACYSYTSLRNEAVYAGWRAGPRPEQAHHCPRCVRSLATPANQIPHLAAR